MKITKDRQFYKRPSIYGPAETPVFLYKSYEPILLFWRVCTQIFLSCKRPLIWYHNILKISCGTYYSVRQLNNWSVLLKALIGQVHSYWMTMYTYMTGYILHKPFHKEAFQGQWNIKHIFSLGVQLVGSTPTDFYG